MADDPTTTGPKVQLTAGGEQVTPGEMTRTLRGLPGAHVREHSQFSFTVKGELLFVTLNNQLTISIQLAECGAAEPYTLELPSYPLFQYGDPDTLNTYLADVKRNFVKVVGARLQREAARTLQAVAMGVYAMMNPGSGDRETIIEGYKADVELHLNELLAPLPERRKPGGWSKIALSQAVARAAYRLALRGMKGRALTLEAVRDEMWQEFREMTPASGEALRKQLDERGLNWRAIKREAVNYAAEVVRRQAQEPKGENETGG